jgi:hypothetical protein
LFERRFYLLSIEVSNLRSGLQIEKDRIELRE